MVDLRPVSYVIGLLITGLGAAMLAPLALDVIEAQGHWSVFAQSALLTILFGATVALAAANLRMSDSLSTQWAARFRAETGYSQ